MTTGLPMSVQGIHLRKETIIVGGSLILVMHILGLVYVILAVGIIQNSCINSNIFKSYLDSR